MEREFIVKYVGGTHGFLIESDEEHKPLIRCKDCRFRYTECCIVKDQPLMDTFYCWQGTPKDGDGD